MHAEFRLGPQITINSLYSTVDNGQSITRRWACNLINSNHAYTDDLLTLEGTPHTAPPTNGISPTHAWEAALSSHPDSRFAGFILRGFASGFRIGFQHTQVALRPQGRNHPSAHEHPEVVRAAIQAEVRAGRLVPATLPVHTSPMGLVPKSSSRPNEFRLILDLSSPKGHSLNDGIDHSLCSLKYAAIDQAIRLLSTFGTRCSLAKFDLASAYRRVPVHPLDQPLLGLTWEGVTYMDKALPFGLRSAPKIFSAVADAISWAVMCNGATGFIHYLDDFLIVGPPGTEATNRHLTTAIRTCTGLGFPVADHKTVSATTTITFLGIQIDSVAETISLPSDKLEALRAMLLSWGQRKAAPKRELLSLLGYLSHASSVVPPGRTFVRHLINASTQVSAPHHFVRLNKQCRADLSWWLEFGTSWGGVSTWPPPNPSVTCFTDASGSWGCGAILGEHPFHWFQLAWPTHWSSHHIAAKELVPVVIAAALWGPEWAGHRVLFHSDNQSVVAAVNSGSSRDHTLAHLLRCLFFFSASWHFTLLARHIPGVQNSAADALSRNKASALPLLVPQANPIPSHLPSTLQDLLLAPDVCWTSPHWLRGFRSFMLTASPAIRQGLTIRGNDVSSGSVSSPV